MYYLYHPHANQYLGVMLHPVDSDIIQIRSRPSPAAEEWTPIPVTMPDENPEEEGDFPSLIDYRSIPMMSQRAWNALRPLIGDCCEALPIAYPTGEPFFLIHVMQTIDSLDADRSEVRRSKIDGRISRIYKYKFRNELLRGKHIFKLSRESGGELFVDDEFRKIVERVT